MKTVIALVIPTILLIAYSKSGFQDYRVFINAVVVRSWVRTMRLASGWVGSLAFCLVLQLHVAAHARTCGQAAIGAIADRYRVLGGSDGPLGCPIGAEAKHPDGNGRVQLFEHGQMVWMPDVDDRAPGIVAGWQADRSVVVDWIVSGHYSYDFFLVRWDKDGRNLGQVDEKGARTSGRRSFTTEAPGRYVVVVKGCDGTATGSRCRQNWSLPLNVAVTSPPPLPSVLKCPIRPYGAIYEKWVALDAGDGPLGCPLAPEANHPQGGGRLQTFQHGQIAFTDGQGDHNAQAAWTQGSRAVLDWGPTDPFHYDKFIVRWDKDGRNVGQSDEPGGNRGRWSVALDDAGTYSLVVEGCDKSELSSSKCRQGWSKPVTLAYAPPAPDYVPQRVARRDVPGPFRQCAPSPSLVGEHLREYWRLGGVNGPMGCFLGLDGTVASFQNGQISVSPDDGDRRVLAAFQDGGNIAVDWFVSMDRPIHSYNKFIVRWDREGLPHSERDQIDVMADICDDQAPIPSGCATYTRTWNLEGGKSLSLNDTHLHDRGALMGGRAIPADRGNGVYSISVEGCDVHWPGGSTCRQGWFQGVRVSVSDNPVPWSPVTHVDLPQQQPATVADATRTIVDRTALGVLAEACGEILPQTDYRDEQGYTTTALARLAYADYFDTDRCPGAPPGQENRPVVFRSLLQQEVGSKAGTTSTGVPIRTGEYDVVLAGLLPIVYRYYHVLPPDVSDHIVRGLLNKTGGPDNGDHVVDGVVPESENHVWQIESSRYLTNDLMFLRTGDPAYDNARNGEERYILERLGEVLRSDFVEYNARPYQDYTSHALTNLYSYARPGPVKTAAQMVLDYISMKVAVSTSDMRRSVPFRRRVSHDGDDFLGGGTCGEPGSCALDPNAARILGLAGTTELVSRADPTHSQMWSSGMFFAGLTDYRIPDPILDLIVTRPHRVFTQRFHHYTDELYTGSPSFTIDAGGQYATFAYAVGPFHSGDDIGLAVPTVLMPTALFASRADLIRFEGASDNVQRSNMCVTEGFACGLGPIVPASYTNGRGGCVFSTDAAGHRAAPGSAAPWTFIDEGSPGCRRSAWPYYVAVYRREDWGFLEAFDVTLATGVGFSDFVARTIAQNAAASFHRDGTNTYVRYGGARIGFTLAHDSRVVSSPGEPDPGKFVSGTLMNSQAPGSFVFTNPATRQQILIDDSDMLRPLRRVD